MKYILDESCELCGWKNLPFALYNEKSGGVKAIPKEAMLFLLTCGGKRETDLKAQSERVRKTAETLLENGLLREAGSGETRTLLYHDYPGVFKLSAQWSLTGKCNYRCRHCFQSAPEGVLGEPDKEQLFDIIRQFRQNGIRLVKLTGGEPLIRGDFFEIVDELLRNGIRIASIFSNGALITEAWLDELGKRNIRPDFNLSFDGIGFHDWMRGVPGAEERARSAVRRLKARGCAVSCGMCLCRENVGAIRETVNALAEDGCRSFSLQRAMPQGEWRKEESHYLTFAETAQAYLDYLPVYKQDGCPLPIRMEGLFSYDPGKSWRIVYDRDLAPEEAELAFPCNSIRSELYVGPNGAVTPCMSMCGASVESLFPNIFKTPLREILTESSYTRITDARVKDILAHNEKCRDCEYRYRCCGGCRAQATGQSCTDYRAPDPLSCEAFRDGWIDRFVSLATELFGERTIKK